MKKVLSFLLSAVIILMTFITAIPVGAEEYAGELEYSLTNAAGEPNDEITLELNIDKNTGFCASIFYIYFSNEVFILKDITFNKELEKKGEFYNSDNDYPPQQANRMGGAAWNAVLSRFAQFNIGLSDKDFKMIFYDATDYADTDFTGTVATLTFQIMGIAEEGDYVIGIMPSPGNTITNESEDGDILVSWKNATVHVGSGDVPKDDNNVIVMTDTVAPEEMTEEPETKSREELESEALNGDTEAPETFKGDDGVIYVVNENGETEVYAPDSEAPEKDDKNDEGGETASAEDGTEKSPDTAEAESETDVAGDATPEEKNTVNIFGLKIPLLYFILAILLLLIAIAAVLFIIISKTKKSDKELDKE